MNIANNHPIRAAVCNIPTYHASKSDALAIIGDVLEQFDMAMADCVDMSESSGSKLVLLRAACAGKFICACCGEKMARETFDNGIVIAWYTMQSGKIELVTYIS